MNKYHFTDEEMRFIEESCIPVAVYQFIDKRVVTLALSKGFCDLFSYNLNEAYPLMDNDMYRDVHKDDVARIADAAFRFAVKDEPYNVLYRSKRGDHYFIVHAYGKHVNTPDGTRLAVIWYNDEGDYDGESGDFKTDFTPAISVALRSESLMRESYYDKLTGLPGMTYFFELAEQGRKTMLNEGKEPVMLFCNLNGMKFYNKKYGFSGGDRLISEVAKVLVRYFSNENCSRFAQDHFAVFTEREGLEDKLNSVIREVGEINGGRTLPIQIGICLSSTGLVDVSTACDRAKYACDLNRENYISSFRYFDVGMLKEAENTQYILDNLDTAIREKWIKVFYQPIVRAANGKICDEEALARWVDPERGMLSPAEFIPVLEDAKIIYKLDLYVLDKILEKLKKRKAEGKRLVSQSLNLSRADLEGRDMVEEIRRRVDAAGIDRSLLSVEITESVVGSDFEFIKGEVERFRALGFPVWMDDFGSGYSSLDVLQNIKFNLIKFDMRFMQRFNECEESRIILTELMRMAIALGLDTICEGVETKEQADFLREIGCAKLQGYYYSKPVPPYEWNEQRAGLEYEDPLDSAYYADLGRVNLYDLSSVTKEDKTATSRYFNTIPMAIVEKNGENFRLSRCNKSFREYFEKSYGTKPDNSDVSISMGRGKSGSAFLEAIGLCASEGTPLMIDEETASQETVHAMIRRVAVNEHTGTAAVVIAILAVLDKREESATVTYANIAKALSSDYRYLFYVDLDTERYVEYTSLAGHGNLDLEQRGDNFFAQSRENARIIIHPDDQEAFIEAFTKENVVAAIDGHGSFTIGYRLTVTGEPRYMSMKAVRMDERDHHIIIGVNDVDAQVRQQEALERISAEQITYSRITALSDEYICLYSVDLETDYFTEYTANDDYNSLGLTKHGADFFELSRKESLRIMHEEDQPRFAKKFTKENILREIKKNKRFTIDYRLIMGGKPRHLRLRAAAVRDANGMQLIIGVTDLDKDTES